MSQYIVPAQWQPDRRTRDGLPLQFEDRTGYITNTDFDDMYDRMHFHVSRLPGHTSTKIFRMGFRPSRVRNALPLPPNPEVSLDFGPHEALGTISLSLMSYTANLPMMQYLQKTSFFARWADIRHCYPHIGLLTYAPVLSLTTTVLCPGSSLRLMVENTNGALE